MKRLLILLILALPLLAAVKPFIIHAESSPFVVKGTIIRVGQACPGDDAPTLINWFVVVELMSGNRLALRAASQAERIVWSNDPYHQDVITSEFCRPHNPVAKEDTL